MKEALNEKCLDYVTKHTTAIFHHDNKCGDSPMGFTVLTKPENWNKRYLYKLGERPAQKEPKIINHGTMPALLHSRWIANSHCIDKWKQMLASNFFYTN